MKKTNEVINVIQCVVMVVLLLLILSILIAMPIGQGVASAEGTSTLTPEEESALLTESDDVEGYAGKTIRDYEEIRTIPDIDYEGVELTLYTTTDDAIVKIVPKSAESTVSTYTRKTVRTSPEATTCIPPCWFST